MMIAPRLSRFRAPPLRALALAGLIASVASGVTAHDFFILPAGARISPGAPLVVNATVAAAFPTLESVVPADRIAEARVLHDRGGASLGIEGPGEKSLKLRLRAQAPGLAVLAVRTVPREVEYAEAQIGGIMGEYEVGPATVRAVENLPKPRVLKAVSTRHAKSFVCVDPCSDRGAAAQAVGHVLEFVAVAGAPDTFRLLAQGAPLSDYPVAVVGADGVRRKLRTARDGVVALPPEARAPVMLFASVMTPPPAPNARFKLDLASLTLRER